MRSDRVLLIALILCISMPLVMADDGQLVYHRWSPVAIYPDGETSATLEVKVEGNVESIRLASGNTQYGELNDDGTNGDRKANDGIWTIAGVTHNSYREWIPGASLRGFDVWVKPKGGEEARTGIGGLAISLKHKQKVTKVAKDVYRTKWGAFLIDEKGEFFDGKMPICNVRCGKGNEKVFQKFFEYFPDKYDFLVVMPFMPVFRPGEEYVENVPYFVPVRNKIRNIGIEVFDNGADFGSKKKLKGVIYHSFGYGAILDHEIGHAWGMRLGEAQGLGFSGNNAPYHYTSGWHFSPYTNQVGQLGMFPQLEVKKNGDGTYKVTKMSDRETEATYSPLELYCMGLIPPEDVPPVMVLKNADYPNYNRVPKSEFAIFTIEQIMAANGGERIPAYPNTPKRFRVGFIFVADREFTQAEYDYFSQIPQYFQAKNDEGMHYLTPFHYATGGRAKILTKMKKPLTN